jgi:hypothetical protein
VLREAFLAIYRPVPAGLEGHFTFLLAVGTNGLVHLSWASEITSASKSAVSHDNFSIGILTPHTKKTMYTIKSYVLKNIYKMENNGFVWSLVWSRSILHH